LFVFWYGRYQMGVPLEDAEAMAFLTLAFIQLFHAYNSKSVFKSLFASIPFDNKWLNIAVLASTVLMLITVFVPGLNDAFGTVHLLGDPMAMKMWTVIILAAASVVLYVEIGKFIIRATGWDEKFTDFYVKYYRRDRKSKRLNSSHVSISYAVFCLNKTKISLIKSELLRQ